MNKIKFNPYLNHNSYHVFFTNLANPLKIGIILSLWQKEKSVSEIVADLVVEQSKVSHALGSLKACNIVKARQKGKQRIYYLNKDTITPMLNLINKHAKVHCSDCCIVNKTCVGCR